MPQMTTSPAVQFGALRGKNYPGAGQAASFVKAKDRGNQPVADDDVVIVAASRTPFGNRNAGLSGVNATALAFVTAKKTLKQSGLDPKKIDSSIWGNIIPSSLGDAYLPKTVSLLLGMNEGATSKTVNRRCASGFAAIEDAVMEIASGKADAVLAGGAEVMSKAPLANFDLPKQSSALTAAVKKGGSIEDAQEKWESLWKPQGLQSPEGFLPLLQGGLTDPYLDEAMPITADRLAEEKNISREDLEKLAVESHERAFRAQQEGRYNIAPVTQSDLDKVNKHLKDQSVLADGVTKVSQDEGPRQSSLESLAKLKTIQPNGRHTAATASQITDGAASVLITSGKFARENGLTPLAKIRTIGNAGVRPGIMGYGPVPAMKLALNADQRKSAKDMDVVEINEAFAVVPEVAIRELNLDRNKVNVNGSGISLGHPLAATGARIVSDLVSELKRQGGKLGIGSACIGGGEGAAIIIENLQK